MKVTAGIDVSKDHLDAHAGGEDRRFANDRDGFRALDGWLRRHGVERVVMESTGRLQRGVHRSLHDRGHAVSVVNPSWPKHFAMSMGRLAKTDRIDAEMLAKFGATIDDLPATPPKGDFLSRLEDRMVIRCKLVEIRQMIVQSTGEVAEDGATKAGEGTRADLDARIAALDADIEAMFEEDAEFGERYRILLSVRGIGKTVAAALCCWMPELGRIGGRQAAALAGVAPVARDSGKKEGPRRIHGGRPRPRKLLYMAAFAASRHDPEMREVYERLMKAGKAHKVAIVAVMRKMIVMINALLRDRREWTPATPSRTACG